MADTTRPARIEERLSEALRSWRSLMLFFAAAPYPLLEAMQRLLAALVVGDAPRGDEARAGLSTLPSVAGALRVEPGA